MDGNGTTCLLGVYLTGYVKFVFNGIEDDSKMTTIRLKQHLNRKRFLIDQYQTRSPQHEETVSEFAQALTELSRSALSYMTQDAEKQINVRNRFIGGLKLEIREGVKLMGPKTRVEAMIGAQLVESILSVENPTTTFLKSISNQLNQINKGSTDIITTIQNPPESYDQDAAWVSRLQNRIKLPETSSS